MFLLGKKTLWKEKTENAGCSHFLLFPKSCLNSDCADTITRRKCISLADNIGKLFTKGTNFKQAQIESILQTSIEILPK